MKLELKDVKMYKAEICKQEKGDHKTSSTDLVQGLHNDVNILNPTTFALIIKRNLSASWYKEIPELDISGRLKSIVVSGNLIIFLVEIIHFNFRKTTH